MNEAIGLADVPKPTRMFRQVGPNEVASVRLDRAKPAWAARTAKRRGHCSTDRTRIHWPIENNEHHKCSG